MCANNEAQCWCLFESDDGIMFLIATIHVILKGRHSPVAFYSWKLLTYSFCILCIQNDTKYKDNLVTDITNGYSDLLKSLNLGMYDKISVGTTY